MSEVELRERMYNALKLVKVLHDKPDCSVPGFLVRLDPKAYEQVSAAIQAYESAHKPPSHQSSSHQSSHQCDHPDCTLCFFQERAGKCDDEIFEKGKVAFVFDSPARVAELLVSMLARETNTRTDWSYDGGRAIVRTLDDVNTVRAAARFLFPTSINWKAGD